MEFVKAFPNEFQILERILFCSFCPWKTNIDNSQWKNVGRRRREKTLKTRFTAQNCGRDTERVCFRYAQISNEFAWLWYFSSVSWRYRKEYEEKEREKIIKYQNFLKNKFFGFLTSFCNGIWDKKKDENILNENGSKAKKSSILFT